MALLECKLGPTETSVGGQTYIFAHDRARRAVAEVHDLVHIRCFLSVQHYIEVQPLPIAPVLLGASSLPAVVRFSPEHSLPLDEVVAEAYAACTVATEDEGALSVDDWNALSEWARLVRIERVIAAKQAEVDQELAENQARRDAEAQRLKEEAEADRVAAEAEAARLAAEAEAAAQGQGAPATTPPIKVVDDLTDIAGIGQPTAAKLADLDITSFAQIARWDEPTIRQLDADLNLKGAITRNDWVGQAKQLQADKDARLAAEAEAAKAKEA